MTTEINLANAVDELIESMDVIGENEHLSCIIVRTEDLELVQEKLQAFKFSQAMKDPIFID